MPAHCNRFRFCTLAHPPLAAAQRQPTKRTAQNIQFENTQEMSSLTLSSPRYHHLSSHAHLHRHPHPPMAIIRHLNLPHLNLRHNRRRYLSVAAAALRQDTTAWTQAPLSEVQTAAEDLFHVTIDVSDSPDLVASHTRPGQYLQLRLSDAEKPSFLAIASPPSTSTSKGEFEFLVKSVAGSTAELLCGLGRGDVVELSQVMGRGFDISQISPPEEYLTVLIFATGSGISPIRSVIESGFGARKRSDVRLYYGARNLQRMAYQDRFKDWESSGVKVVPVLSRSDDRWEGERGYVQAAFDRAKQTYNPSSTGALLCGQKQMSEVCLCFKIS
ncbi:fruit protein pKIWI502-like [Macadamia integrifolia]|uniref:fruit protein pKIWI502-like n=1 Tax=Macadamia integrifolia TaxID=60698 RepID=UPI001C52C4EC|nr:fruit protein pKIWI502-like [Macadamia integrifolia]